MSLTGLLKNPESNVSRFFAAHFPDRERFEKVWRQKIAGAPTISPHGQTWKYPWSLAGQALDYRLRRCFEFYRAQETVAARGGDVAGHLANIGVGDYSHNRSVCGLWYEMSLSPRRQREWKKARGEELIRWCLAFAKFETIARSGKVDIRMPTNADELLASFPANVVEDIQALTNLFEKVSWDKLKMPAILNPTFDGSADVGGADADIIIGKTLIDFKATIHPENLGESFWPYQLLGYGLLDYGDRYKMQAAGIYLCRQGLWVIYVWQELCDLLGADPGVSWHGWQDIFHETIWTD